MIECVPNFSEGRDIAKVRAIVDAIAAAPGVRIVGWESDVDHNRSVVTFAGEPDDVMEGAIRGAGKAAELIDLNRHQGVHPRVGAADVIPFVPLAESTMDDCIAIAYRTGEQLWRRFGIPVYFYESAALRENRRRLEKVRRAGFDGAPPDIGDIASHPTVGASVVGARGFLIAYNVNLDTADPNIAREIAKKIRESSGGFRFVKAMGLFLPSRNCAQVSMNLTKFSEIPMGQVYDAIAAEATALGTKIAASQLIGLIPQRAFDLAPDFFRRIDNFDDSRIIETQLKSTHPVQ